MYDRLAAFYDDVVVDPVHGSWADFADAAWSDDAAPVRRVLDVCCGTGRMSAELIARGYDVTGVDGSGAMLVEARALLGPDVTLVESVLPALAVDAGFDAAVCNFDSLNYLPLPDVRISMRAVARRLRPGGWLVLDLHTETMMRTIAEAPLSAWRSGDTSFGIENDVDLETRHCLTRLDVSPDDGEPFTETHDQYFFSEAEVAGAARDAGFEVVRLVDDYGPEPVGPATLRSTWVLRKPTA